MKLSNWLRKNQYGYQITNIRLLLNYQTGYEITNMAIKLPIWLSNYQYGCEITNYFHEITNRPMAMKLPIMAMKLKKWLLIRITKPHRNAASRLGVK